MKPNKIWLVVPFSRPQYLDNVIENAKRQNYKDIKICIVENGDAIGHCKKVGFEPDLLITSGAHQSKAKNAGIEAIKEQGGGFVSIFDDDDYYGPNYLQEVYDNSEKGDVVGKLCIITKLVNNQMVLTHDVGFFNTYAPYVQSATASYWAEDAYPYSESMRSGEENFWAGQMTRSGRSIYATTPFNFCYMRRDGGHTYQATDKEFMDKGSRLIGEFDLDIINRVKKVDILEVRANAPSNFEFIKSTRQSRKLEVQKIIEDSAALKKHTPENKAEFLKIAQERREDANKKLKEKRNALKK